MYTLDLKLAQFTAEHVFNKVVRLAVTMSEYRDVIRGVGVGRPGRGGAFTRETIQLNRGSDGGSARIKPGVRGAEYTIQFPIKILIRFFIRNGASAMLLQTNWLCSGSGY